MASGDGSGLPPASIYMNMGAGTSDADAHGKTPRTWLMVLVAIAFAASAPVLYFALTATT